ncbi:MAG: F0F1 ATP synthase subunit epsilon [SAR202 cluster bacterium]|nr:F0F1 ATP synthase subunit epsilon [SAR202 cluster bacterium]
MATLRLEIVSAERSVLDDEVDALIAPGVEGQLTILPHHAALLTQLQPGEITIRKGGQETNMAVSGGFLEVMANRAVILADTAERAEEIDIDRAEKALKSAQEAIAGRGAAEELESALAAFQRARIRVEVARRRRRGMGGGREQ